MNTASIPHNPDNLTDEQIQTSEGWRLLDEDEIIDTPYVLTEVNYWVAPGEWEFPGCGNGTAYTYRTQLTRAELRAARKLAPESNPMNNEPETPRTDAEIRRIEADEIQFEDRHDCYCELLKFSRTLERELATAQAELALEAADAMRLAGLLDRVTAERDAANATIVELREERDELIRRRDFLKSKGITYQATKP